MMPIPIQCSQCDAVLNLKDDAEDTLGKKMRCPKCGEVFVMRRYRPKKAARKQEVVEDDAGDDDEYIEPAPRRSKKRGAKKRPFPVAKVLIPAVIGIVLIGLGLSAWHIVPRLLPDKQPANGTPENVAVVEPPAIDFHVPIEFADWKPVTILPGVFEIHMPGVPKVGTWPSGTPYYRIDRDGLTIRVTDCDQVSGKISKKDVSNLFDIPEPGMRVVSDEETTFLNKYPCRNVEMLEDVHPTPPIQQHYKVITVDSHIFMVTVACMPRYSYQAETAFCFGSIKINGRHDHRLAGTYTDPERSKPNRWPVFALPTDITPTVTLQAPNGFLEVPETKKLKQWEIVNCDLTGWIAASAKELSMPEVKSSMDAFVSGLRTRNDATVLSERAIRHGDIEGLELRQRLSAGGISVARVYAVHPRVISLLVIGADTPEVSAQQTRVLDSVSIGGQTASQQ